MSRFTIAAMLVAALSAAGCSNNTTTSPTTPTVTPVTDTFTGTLTHNGASSFAFSVSAGGLVYASLTSVADPSVVVGLSLGTWNTGSSSCTTVIANDGALQGTTITASATGIGTLCARVYDVGKVVDPLDYQITITHP